MRCIGQLDLKQFTRRDLIAADLFCGCGGFSMGLIQAGINVVVGVDNEPTALNTYQYNLGAPDCRWIGDPPERWKRLYIKNHKGCYRSEDSEAAWPPHPRKDKTPWKRTVKAVICADIMKLSGAQILEYAGVDHVDVIVGSPPCQSFSAARAGGQLKYDTRDELSFEMARIVDELQPKFMCMENVPYFAKKKLPDGRLILDVFNDIVKHGYWKKYDRMNLVKDRMDLAIRQERVALNPVEFDYVTASNLAKQVSGRFMVVEGIE